ncbi:hypothetical protein [Tenacibaculum ovolyticum]|uniref:hypothetical protein n=1 Tax=Tenacibaculum ovolyticum TaxID=104270 RepID=UPI003BA97C88
MTEKYFQILITILLPLIGGGVGFLLKRYLDKKREVFNENAKERRQAYQDFIDLIIDLFANSKLKNNKKLDINKLYTFYKRNILFAPPKVVNAFSDYMQFLYHYDDNDETAKYTQIKKLTKVIKEMRADLGLKNKGLGKNGERLMRAIINDFDKMDI